jgi:hypothetical protein
VRLLIRRGRYGEIHCHHLSREDVVVGVAQGVGAYRVKT